MWNKLIISLCFLVVAGCSDADKTTVAPQKKVVAISPAATRPPGFKDYRIVDSFEVGANVYVRSMLVDTKRKALWVGTSVGVHEIDLDSLAVRQTFTRDNGLANEYVFSMGRDAENSIWFGTNAGGASRFKDGNWKTYFPMHGLADYWVYSFASHPDGRLWIGTWAGVNRLDLKTDHMETFVKELVNEWVYAMVIDTKGRTWFGTEGGISRFDGKNWHEWTHMDGLGAANTHHLPASANTGLGTRSRHDLGVLSSGGPTYNPNYVFSLLIDPDDTLWAGTWGGGISRFDGQHWQSYNVGDGLPGNIVYSMVRDTHGVLWAGTDNGLGYLRDGKWVPFSKNHALFGLSVYTLVATPSGEVWAGTRGKVIRIAPEATN